jgi:hypothetical protein
MIAASFGVDEKIEEAGLGRGESIGSEDREELRISGLLIPILGDGFSDGSGIVSGDVFRNEMSEWGGKVEPIDWRSDHG